ncbi:Catechol 2,3-dioxygenase [Loktanella sp. DSM 29012]|uniref:VOC family protein n=1 Tax=Loktanella sp. DSM 29012 TaxID=1881056 RepID=UPI0008D34B1A|nr:VOC family protein [Loktanella sp. DSM 29012]SEP83409.1 Catechol 2,3-dioxygenase [Loktanella sp. DSM 29012]
MPKLVKILETAIYVADLERAQTFYSEIMGLEPLKTSDRLCAMNVNGQSILLLFHKGGTADGAVADGENDIPPHDADGRIHFAFETSHDELNDWITHLDQHDVEILSRTSWLRGGKSIYFRDPDGHLLELAASPGLWPDH